MMQPVAQHPLPPDTSFDGGDLDCGSGLLLLIRRHIDPLPQGGLLEICSTESSVGEDLPAWCRLTGNELVSVVRRDRQQRFLVCKGSLSERRDANSPSASESRRTQTAAARESSSVETRAEPAVAAAPLQIPPLAVMGIGSWPRPRWLLGAIHDHVAGRLADDEFQEIADDAVRLCVEAQHRAGVDVVTDGEQRRDSYASFVGGLLDNCQLIPITDLLPYVSDPDEFERELRALDVPAAKVRHPAVFGPIRRSRPLVVPELRFLRRVSDRPAKVALPGPYLLTRTMWMECLSDRAYDDREALADDVVRVLREELQALLASGAAVVQFDEPVLTEVVFGTPQGGRSFMCGALSERRSPHEELTFAARLLNRVVAELPRERLGLHICRGNWTRDESVALKGDYQPLLPFLHEVQVGHFFLELSTPRAGELSVLRDLPANCRLGLGVVNQKLDRVESVDEVVARARQAVETFGPDRVLLNPDCGFATFADNPIASAETAERKLAVMAQAARILRQIV